MIIRTVAKFEAAHRQLGDESKCGYLHGHNWKVEFFITGKITGQVGYIIDFKILKEIVYRYDHKVLLKKGDPLIPVLLIHGQHVEEMEVNPTAEHLASSIKKFVIDQLDFANIEWSNVMIRVWENEESYAEAGSL